MSMSNSKKSTGGSVGQSQSDKLKEARELIKLVVCDKCGEDFLLKAIDIKAKTQDIDNVRLWLTWFMCPACGQSYKINIEDDDSKELLEEVLALRARIKNAVERGHTPRPTLQKTLTRKEQKYNMAHHKVAKYYDYLFTELEESEGANLK